MTTTNTLLEKQLPTHERIAERAKQIYHARGGHPGHEMDDWLQAEYEMMRMPTSQIATLPLPKGAKGKSKTAAKAIKASALIMLVQSALLIGM
jgi:hypothetical protein